MNRVSTDQEYHFDFINFFWDYMGIKFPSVHTDKVHTVIQIFKVLMSVKVQGKLPGKDGLLQTRLIYS